MHVNDLIMAYCFVHWVWSVLKNFYPLRWNIPPDQLPSWQLPTYSKNTFLLPYHLFATCYLVLMNIYAHGCRLKNCVQRYNFFRNCRHPPILNNVNKPFFYLIFASNRHFCLLFPPTFLNQSAL